MSHTSHSIPSAPFAGWALAVMGLFRDAAVMADALLFPGRIIAEVSEMRALQVQAERIAATDPARAAALRQRAARIGL